MPKDIRGISGNVRGLYKLPDVLQGFSEPFHGVSAGASRSLTYSQRTAWRSSNRHSTNQLSELISKFSFPWTPPRISSDFFFHVYCQDFLRSDCFSTFLFSRTLIRITVDLLQGLVQELLHEFHRELTQRLIPEFLLLFFLKFLRGFV